MKPDKFILDAHLGKLARYMRMLGFDAVFDSALDDMQIIHKATQENRIVLSKDRALILDKRIISSYFVIATGLREQLIEIIKYFDLAGAINAFTRCLDCNGKIVFVNKTNIKNELFSGVLNQYENFTRCQDCKKIFWEGSHHQKMGNFIKELQHELQK